jgi:hypothetical protein
MTPDLTEWKRLAEAAFNAGVEADMFQKGSKSHQDADVVRIMKLSEMRYALTPQAVLALIARVEKLDAALKVIKTPGRGSELKDTDADACQYWAKQCVRLQSIARTALEQP